MLSNHLISFLNFTTSPKIATTGVDIFTEFNFSIILYKSPTIIFCLEVVPDPIKATGVFLSNPLFMNTSTIFSIFFRPIKTIKVSPYGNIFLNPINFSGEFKTSVPVRTIPASNFSLMK